MTEEFGKPESAKPGSHPDAAVNPKLGSTLLPPSDGGRLLTIGTDPGADSGKAISDEMAAQLNRAGDEARELAGRAAALAAEKAPELKKMAHMASERASAFASRAFKEAEASAQAAASVLADRDRRKASLAANRKWLGIAAGVLVVVIGGGWIFAKHRATAMAQDRIDSLLIRTGLRANINYDSISASPFGSATLSGVVIRDRTGVVAKIGALEISDIETKGDLVEGFSLSGDEVEVPFRTWARGALPQEATVELAGLGYTVLKGDFSISTHFDETDGTDSFEARGNVRDLGSFKYKLTIGGIDATAFQSLADLPQSYAENPLMAVGIAMAQLPKLTLSDLGFTLDDSGFIKRGQDIPKTDLPPDDSAPAAKPAAGDAEVAALVQAGLSASEAKADCDAFSDWVKNGGTIRLQSHIEHPVALFNQNNPFGESDLFGGRTSFDKLAQFLAMTKSTVTD